MYRNQELPAVLAWGQFRYLDKYNDIGIDNANFLTKELRKIPGLIPPYGPPECKHVYFRYNLCFNPQVAGVDCEPRQFRR